MQTFKKKRCLVARLLSPHPCLPPRWLMMLVPEVHGFLTLQAGQTKALLNAISIVVNLHRSIYNEQFHEKWPERAQ